MDPSPAVGQSGEIQLRLGRACWLGFARAPSVLAFCFRHTVANLRKELSHDCGEKGLDPVRGFAFSVALPVHPPPKTGARLVQATIPFAKESVAGSWWHVASTGLLLGGFFAGTLLLPSLIARLGCSILAGLTMIRFFVIFHDQQHHAILAKSRIAEVGMRLFGIFVLSPSSIWRESHDYHHKHNSKLRSAHIGSFPVMTRANYIASSKRERLHYLAMRHPLTIFLGYISVFMVGMSIAPFLKDPRKHLDGLFAVLVHLAIAAALVVYFGWVALLLTQTIPFLVTLSLGSYLFYAQHNFPGVIYSDSAGWAYEKAALESSSYLKGNWFVAWFTGNIGYHHIHHINHRIPFYRLPEVFNAIPELQSPSVTSLAPMEMIRCLRLKVWDAEAGRMVGLAEL